jgi:hypothetical protein
VVLAGEMFAKDYVEFEDKIKSMLATTVRTAHTHSACLPCSTHALAACVCACLLETDVQESKLHALPFSHLIRCIFCESVFV